MSLDFEVEFEHRASQGSRLLRVGVALDDVLAASAEELSEAARLALEVGREWDRAQAATLRSAMEGAAYVSAFALFAIFAETAMYFDDDPDPDAYYGVVPPRPALPWERLD